MNLLTTAFTLYHSLTPTTSQTDCTTSISGEITSYTSTVGNGCGSITCLDGYDCEISCGSHSCALDINGPDSEYDLSIDCTGANGCQRANIDMSHSVSSNFYINCGGGLYACEQTSTTSPQSGSLTLDCTYEKTCEHYYLTVSNSDTTSFLSIDITCTQSHSCYDLWIDGTSGEFIFGNINIICEASNSCQNSYFYQAYYGSFSIECSGQLSCAGSELGIILNNNDIDNEVINSYQDGIGTFGCIGQFSCQGTILYCPNYQDCSITCESDISCDSLTAYCPKYGGICTVDCSNSDSACNAIELHTYNGNYEIINAPTGNGITVIDTTIDLSNIEIVMVTNGDLDDIIVDGDDSSDDGRNGTSKNSNANSSGSGGIGLDHGSSMVVALTIAISIVLLCVIIGIVFQKRQRKGSVEEEHGVLNGTSNGAGTDGKTQAIQEVETNVVYSN